MTRSWLNWKTLVIVALGLVIAGPLIRELASVAKLPTGVMQRGPAAPAETQAPSAPTSAPTEAPAPRHTAAAKAPKTAAAAANGQAIPSTGQPTILLNPGMVRPGTKVAVSGFGFDPGAVVDVMLKKSSGDAGTAVTLAKVDETGSFDATFIVPSNLASRSPTVAVQERNSNKAARTTALMPASMASVKLGKATGKPGDRISLSASGFEPEEDIKVYWGQLNGDPAATLHADGGGNVGQASVLIPVGAIGTTSIVLVGSKSQSLAIGQFYMLGLYPTVKASPWAVKSGNRINLSAKGFGPGETVLVYVNGMNGPPLMTVQTDGSGSFYGAGFVAPFGLKGKQSLILIGEQSRATVNSGFQVLPYTPSVQPSTYGGFPGTTLSFYASGFAPNEVVLVYKARGRAGGGQLVTAFRVDGRGRAAAAGHYMVAGDDQGKVSFTAVGRLSQGTAVATVTIDHSDVPVQVPPQPQYTLPPDLQPTPAPSGKPGNQPGEQPTNSPPPSQGAGDQTPTDQGTTDQGAAGQDQTPAPGG